MFTRTRLQLYAKLNHEMPQPSIPHFSCMAHTWNVFLAHRVAPFLHQMFNLEFLSDALQCAYPFLFHFQLPQELKKKYRRRNVWLLTQYVINFQIYCISFADLLFYALIQNTDTHWICMIVACSYSQSKIYLLKELNKQHRTWKKCKRTADTVCTWNQTLNVASFLPFLLYWLCDWIDHVWQISEGDENSVDVKEGSVVAPKSCFMWLTYQLVANCYLLSPVGKLHYVNRNATWLLCALF